jgi:hypothetical protein
MGIEPVSRLALAATLLAWAGSAWAEPVEPAPASPPLGVGAQAGPPSVDLPAWIARVGARQRPADGPVFWVNAFGAVPGAEIDATSAIQRAIDACAAQGGGAVAFAPGRYLTAALFLKSGVRLRIDSGVTLVASLDERAYPIQPTRVAGIEMPWPAGLINVDDQVNVEISGGGTIDGQGPFWWRKYWTMRQAYEARGVRWAADYDCQRIRLLVVWKSRDVTVANLRLRRSGFWTVQLTYDENVSVDAVTIADNVGTGGLRGASTDGVDIDSSRRVLVQYCDIDNNDDTICLKAGRDADGLRVNRPTEFVVIRDNVCRRGGGVVSFGSETSGGIRHVVAYRNTGLGTTEGIRFKSSRTRGGGVTDVLVRDITLHQVRFPFTFALNWDPAFSYARIPPGFPNAPAYWRTLATPVEPPERGYPDFRNITLARIQADGADRILTAEGLPEKPLGAVRWEDIAAVGREAGRVQDARDWTMRDVHFATADGRPLRVVRADRVDSPLVVPR